MTKLQTEGKKVDIYSVSSALAFLVLNKYPELSWNTLFKKMYEDKNFRKEVMDYLDERFIAKVLIGSTKKK